MITAAMVKELRESTGAGIMDCKGALQEAEDPGLACSMPPEGREAPQTPVPRNPRVPNIVSSPRGRRYSRPPRISTS